MGADNWAICPKCKAKEDSVKEKLRYKLKDSYGKVPQAKYMELVRQTNLPSQLQEGLREYYSVLLYKDGLFSVSYHCYCDRCGFEFKFKHEEMVKL